MSLSDAMKIEQEYLATDDTSHFYFAEKMDAVPPARASMAVSGFTRDDLIAEIKSWL